MVKGRGGSREWNGVSAVGWATDPKHLTAKNSLLSRIRPGTEIWTKAKPTVRQSCVSHSKTGWLGRWTHLCSVTYTPALRKADNPNSQLNALTSLQINCTGNKTREAFPAGSSRRAAQLKSDPQHPWPWSRGENINLNTFSLKLYQWFTDKRESKAQRPQIEIQARDAKTSSAPVHNLNQDLS